MKIINNVNNVKFLLLAIYNSPAVAIAVQNCKYAVLYVIMLLGSFWNLVPILHQVINKSSGNFLVCRSAQICGLMNLIKSADPPMSAADFFFKKKCWIFNKWSSAKIFRKKKSEILYNLLLYCNIMPILFKCIYNVFIINVLV
jgi:hypothetical protein